MYDYQAILSCGWPSGVHDVRSFGYQHPWLVVDRRNRRVEGCWSRDEAKGLWGVWRKERLDAPIEWAAQFDEL